MRKLISALALAALLSGCTPLERTAYETVVASKAFTDKIKSAHPECTTGAASTLCVNLAKAIAAKDVLIDSVELYCVGPNFSSGGACNPPAKGTPAAVQATAKVKAALANYNQVAADLKTAIQ